MAAGSISAGMDVILDPFRVASRIRSPLQNIGDQHGKHITKLNASMYIVEWL